MSHKITFKYMDGEELVIFQKEEDIAAFMKAIGNSEVYYNSEKGHGIWIPIDRIRHFHITKEEVEVTEIMKKKKKKNSEK